MNLSKQAIKGNKIQCVLYLDAEVFEKVEQSRGLTKRSTFIEHIVKSNIEQKYAC